MLHEPKVIKRRNVVVTDLKGLLEHVNSEVVLLCVLIGESFAVIELGIGRHEPNRCIEVLMGLLNPSQGQVGVSSVEESTGVLGVERQGFIVFL
jgi:hypothetical protein